MFTGALKCRHGCIFTPLSSGCLQLFTPCPVCGWVSVHSSWFVNLHVAVAPSLCRAEWNKRTISDSQLRLGQRGLSSWTRKQACIYFRSRLRLWTVLDGRALFGSVSNRGNDKMQRFTKTQKEQHPFGSVVGFEGEKPKINSHKCHHNLPDVITIICITAHLQWNS